MSTLQQDIHNPMKLRCWDSQYSKWRLADEFFLRPDGMVVSSALKERPDWKPIRFTGLSDKSGKEIWEGDILKGVGNVPRNVVWNQQMARYELSYMSFAFSLNELEIKTVKMEVIGNVYENKELLNPPHSIDMQENGKIVVYTFDKNCHLCQYTGAGNHPFHEYL